MPLRVEQSWKLPVHLLGHPSATRTPGQRAHLPPLRGGEAREAAALPGLGCHAAAGTSDGQGRPAEARHISAAASLAGLARLLAHQAAREVQPPGSAGLDPDDLDGRVNRPPEPDRPSAGLQGGPVAGATPRRADDHGLISGRPCRPNRGRG
jgi:hypothetical protein